MLTLRDFNPVVHTQADGYQAGAEGEKRKIKWVPMDSWTAANGADLRGSEALSTAHPSGQRALPGDGGVCEVFNHTSSKRKKKSKPGAAKGSSFKRMTK